MNMRYHMKVVIKSTNTGFLSYWKTGKITSAQKVRKNLKKISEIWKSQRISFICVLSCDRILLSSEVCLQKNSNFAFTNGIFNKFTFLA